MSVEDGLALIAVVGQGMIYAKGTAARIFRVIADANINIRMIDQGSSELNIIIAVKETDYELAHFAAAVLYHFDFFHDKCLLRKLYVAGGDPISSPFGFMIHSHAT